MSWFWDEATGTNEVERINDRMAETQSRREVDIDRAQDALRDVRPLLQQLDQLAREVRRASSERPAMPPPMAFPAGRISAVAATVQGAQAGIGTLDAEMRSTVSKWIKVFEGNEGRPPGRWDIWASSFSRDNLEDIGDELVDVGKGLVSPITGTIQVIRHPIESAKGLHQIVSHPRESFDAAVTHLRDPLHWPELISSAAGTIATGGVGGSASKVAQAGSKASAARAAANAARTRFVDSAGRRATGQRAPGLDGKMREMDRLEQRARDLERNAPSGPLSYLVPGGSVRGALERIRAALAAARRNPEGSTNVAGLGPATARVVTAPVRQLPRQALDLVDNLHDALRALPGVPGRPRPSVALTAQTLSTTVITSFLTPFRDLGGWLGLGQQQGAGDG